MAEMQTQILYVATDEISMRDIPEALVALGYDVLELNSHVTAQGLHADEIEWLEQILSEVSTISYVITYDFIPSVAEACHAQNKIYISWVYDAPQKELYTTSAQYDTNRIFVFDERQWMHLRSVGVKNIFHMPLSVSPEKVNLALASVILEMQDEVSFVGQLYDTSAFQSIVDAAPEVAKSEFMNSIEPFVLRWPDRKQDDYRLLHDAMPRSMADYLSAYENHQKAQDYPYMGERWFYEAAVMARMIANKERITILNELSAIANVSLYTRDKDVSLLDTKVQVKPGVGFDKEVYGVYRNSKINLNITLHCIETGIPQRVFDVLAAGGFLITNYQSELEQYFTIGKDLVVYHNLDELNQLVSYYLVHDAEREEIARQGQITVQTRHSYIKRMQEVMLTLQRFEQEKGMHTLIMTTPKDFERLEVIHPKMIENLYPRKVVFLGSQKVKELLDASPVAGKAGFVDEEEVLPFADVHKVMMDTLGVEELPRGITGWYYQQFLKMRYAYVCDRDCYMTWDGDTVPCAPFSMYAGDGVTPYFDLKSEYHEDYFETLGVLFPGMGKVIKGSFISEHMLFRCDIMKKMIEEIERNQSIPGTTFYEKIIHAIAKEKLQSNSFSEFETYGTYVALKYNTAYRLRDWHSFRYGAAFMHPEIMTDEEYLWLSRDFEAISFEKNQSVRSDHENLFHNKEYQSKLSARQMLEIVQETFTEGFIEKW